MSENAVLLKSITFGGFEIKDAEKGEIAAKVATLGVVDKDRDIIRKSALPKAAKVAMSSWGHDAVFGARPAGSGKLKTVGNDLVFEGRAFLKTWNGRETFETLKEFPEAEWSFGFHITEWDDPSDEERKAGAVRIITKMEAFEVSPVLLGAGIGTGTTSIKAASQADGAAEEPEPVNPELAIIAEAVTKQVLAQREAERKVASDAEAATAEAARVEAETKAQAEAAAAEVERVRLADLATKEFERLQRNLRQHGA
jgi:hypothetical protein